MSAARLPLHQVQLLGQLRTAGIRTDRIHLLAQALAMTSGCTRDPDEVYAASLRARERIRALTDPDKQETPRIAVREVSTNDVLSRSTPWSLHRA